MNWSGHGSTWFDPWVDRLRLLLDSLCLLILLIVLGTVIYGLFLRAHYETNYYIPAAVAVIGAFVILLGLAQQRIAARDAATWRQIAEGQIAMAAKRVQDEQAGNDPGDLARIAGFDGIGYQEQLLEALIDVMKEHPGMRR